LLVVAAVEEVRFQLAQELEEVVQAGSVLGQVCQYLLVQRTL
jgi:hypothetical protein